MDNDMGSFGRFAAEEADYHLSRRTEAQAWNSYAAGQAGLRAAAEHESTSAAVRATERVHRPPLRRLRLAALLTVGVGSMMASSAQASPDVQSVEAQASTLPAAASQQAAEENQKALAPSVKVSIAAGHGRELLESTSSLDVRADLLRFGATVTQTHSPASVYAKPTNAPKAQASRRVRVHSAGCYGHPWSQTYWNVAGGTIGWLYVRANGWCGQNGYMTWLGGATFAQWAWGIYCFTGVGHDYSWDGYPAWVHMANWGSLGVSYPWGCAGIRGGKVQIRIAWNGYWDEYNDYGF
jgi:hypothetical protein